MAQEDHELVVLEAEQIELEEREDGEGNTEQSFVALQEEDVEHARCHVEGQVIGEQSDEPVRSVDVRWDAVRREMLVQVR